MTKSRANRHYHSRSRSRSPSRNISERTGKASKTRESVRTSVKERLEIRKTGDARSLLTRSDVRTCDSIVSKKSVSKKDSKSTTDLPLANGAISGSKHKPVTVKANEVKNQATKRSQISAVREKRRPEYSETKKTGGERLNQSEQRTRA